MKNYRFPFSSLLPLVFCVALHSEEAKPIDSLIQLTSNNKILSLKGAEINEYFKGLCLFRLRDSTDQTMIFVADKQLPIFFKEVRTEFSEISGGKQNRWSFNFFIATFSIADTMPFPNIVKKYDRQLKKSGHKNDLGDEINYHWDMSPRFGLIVSAPSKSSHLITVQISRKENED